VKFWYSKLAVLSLVSLVGCGDKPSKTDDKIEDAVEQNGEKRPSSHSVLDKEGLTFRFSFTKNDPPSVTSAFEQLSAITRDKYGPILNDLLKELGLLGLELKNMRLVQKPGLVVTGTHITPNYDPNLFQTMDLVADVRRAHNGVGKGHATFGGLEIVTRKLVWPGLPQKTVEQLPKQYDDLVFPADTTSSSGPATWVVRIPYRDLVSSFVYRNNILLFDGEKAEALRDQFKKSSEPCTGMETALKGFTAQFFSDLGSVASTSCSIAEKQVPLWPAGVKLPPGVDKNATRTNESTELKFSIGGKDFQIKSKWRDKGLPDYDSIQSLVTTLVLSRYDKIFGSGGTSH